MFHCIKINYTTVLCMKIKQGYVKYPEGYLGPSSQVSLSLNDHGSERGSWSDGSQFKRNAIKSIFTWIRLLDVPHSYWSVEGLATLPKW